MKKVLIISYYFPPSGGAGVQRWLKMLKYLPQYGVEPIVLTVDEKYASYPQVDKSLLDEIPSWLKIYKTKTREVLSLYKSVSPTKEIPYSGFANEPKPTFLQKMARFVRGNFFLPDPRKGWNRYAYQVACQIIEKEAVDAVITTSPPHSTQLLGIKLKKRFPNLTWLADLRDPWTDIYYNKDFLYDLVKYEEDYIGIKYFTEQYLIQKENEINQIDSKKLSEIDMENSMLFSLQLSKENIEIQKDYAYKYLEAKDDETKIKYLKGFTFCTFPLLPEFIIEETKSKNTKLRVLAYQVLRNMDNGIVKFTYPL